MILDRAIISDLHLGHVNIAKMRGFDDIDEYNEVVIERYNSVIGKNTFVIMVGDVTYENKKLYPLISRLKGRIAFVLGNHELRQDVRELLKYVDTVSGALEYKGFIFTHIPIHTSEVSRYRGNGHGHLHKDIINFWGPMIPGVSIKEMADKRYFNVSWDRLDGIPIGFEEFESKFIKIRK